jgi:hypothetical protein
MSQVAPTSALMAMSALASPALNSIRSAKLRSTMNSGMASALVFRPLKRSVTDV